MSRGSSIWSIGTAVPEHRVTRQQALRFMKASYGRQLERDRRLDYLYRRSHIDVRHSCCPEFGRPPEKGREHSARVVGSCLFGASGLDRRMARFETAVVPLVCEAATKALANCGDHLRPLDITHVITVSCTGFFSPGPEVQIIEGLGLRRDIRRLNIGFMGCQAALHALQVADAICRGAPDAVVLIICAELCTIHFHGEPSEENLIINSLFADGAAAAVVSSRQTAPVARFELQSFRSYVVPNTESLISWRIGRDHFNMGLDRDAVRAIGAHLPDFVNSLLSTADTARTDSLGWAVHPGGRAVLDRVEACLDLREVDLQASRQVLRQYGNMSSPTVLFVLDKVLHPGGVALSFGPGLTMEGMVWSNGRQGGV